MSSNLELVAPTNEELIRIWTSTHPTWGAALHLQAYIDRESQQVDIPLGRNKGLTRWALTDHSSGRPERPILSSCETLKKRGLVRPAGGSGSDVRDVVVHGVASVFTDPEFRRKGYAGVMMEKLGEFLDLLERVVPDEAAFSVLFSDIGKTFYAKNGWRAFESNHLEFPATTSSSPSPANLKTISPEDLPSLAEADEALLRKKFAEAPPSSKTLVAILPEVDQMQWHTARERMQCERLFSRTPATNGVVYTTPSSARVWAIWKRHHSGPVAQPEQNTLFILRLVIEDESISDEELGEAIEAIVSAGRKEAAEWACSKVEMWNPSDRVRSLAESNEKLGAKYVVREEDSITSLRWCENASTDDVEWIGNEKYCWC